MEKKFNKQAYLKSYYDMLLWRKFEEKCAALYIQQKIRGFLHLYNGQEAILSGLINSIDVKKDYVKAQIKFTKDKYFKLYK